MVFFFLVLQYLITHFSEFQLASVGTFLLHESVFFLSGLPFMVLERAGFLSKYKIQVRQSPLLYDNRIGDRPSISSLEPEIARCVK